MHRNEQSSPTLNKPPTDLDLLFFSLETLVMHRATENMRTVAVQQVQEIKIQVAAGAQADDNRISELVVRLVDAVPAAGASLLVLFSAPIVEDAIGPLTKSTLGRLHQN